MDDEIFQQLIQAPGESFSHPEMRAPACKFGNHSDSVLGELENGSFPLLGISDEHNTAALIASSMHSEYLDEWSAASSYDNSNLLNFIPQEQANSGPLDYKFGSHPDPVLGELARGTFPPLRDTIDVEQYSDLQEIGGHGVSSDLGNNMGDELDDYFLTTMDPAAPVHSELNELEEIDEFSFLKTLDSFEKNIAQNLLRMKPSAGSINSALEASPQTKKTPQKTRRKLNVWSPSPEIVPLDQKSPTKIKKKSTLRPSPLDAVLSDQKTETEMISDGKARQKNVTGDETKLIQVQKGLSSTISKNRLMDLKKPNVFLKTPSYLTTFPTNCDEYPVVFCCNDCAQMFFKLRAGQMHQCIKKHPGRKVKC